MKRVVIFALLVLTGCSPRRVGQTSPPVSAPHSTQASPEVKRHLLSTGWRLLETMVLVASNADQTSSVLTFADPYARFYISERTTILVDEQTANAEDLWHAVLQSKCCLSMKVTYYEGDDAACIVEAISAIRSTPPEKLTRDTSKR